MELLENMIREQGERRPGGVVKVDGFLNHRLDWTLYREMGKEFYRLFGDDGVTLILTVEASGIAIAAVAAQYFEVPVVFAKKAKTKNLDTELWCSRVESFTHGGFSDIVVSKRYISPDDRVLIIDDFLANGAAARGLISIVERSGATLVGLGVAVEKAFQPGGASLRAEGVKVLALARIKNIDGELEFLDNC